MVNLKNNKQRFWGLLGPSMLCTEVVGHDDTIYINNPGARGSAAKFFFAKAEKRL